jgi:alpha-beta hydrolase superfamily lysophospholipase
MPSAFMPGCRASAATIASCGWILRGHGQSQVPPASSPLDMGRLVSDVEELLGHLGETSVHIVGNSAGG